METLLPPIRALARTMALAGGLVLTALIVLACVSILGRGLNTLAHSDGFAAALPGIAAWLIDQGVGPVTGDFEVIESGIAFAIFAFLPLCQLSGGHAVVDVFTRPLPAGINRFLVAFWEVVLTLVIAVIAWRLFIGMLDKYDNQQTTFLLQFPVWWSYAASAVAAFVAVIVGLYCAAARVTGVIEGRDILPDGGSGH